MYGRSLTQSSTAGRPPAPPFCWRLRVKSAHRAPCERRLFSLPPPPPVRGLCRAMLSSRLAREAQVLGGCVLRCRSRLQLDIARRALSTTATTASASASPSTSSTASPTPWFVDSEEEPSPYARRAALPQAPTKPLAPLPAAIPSDHPIARLHAELKASPHLEPGTLLVREPIPTATGPPLPATMPKGRRQRGRSYVGEGVAGDTGGIWEWLVIAQVRR